MKISGNVLLHIYIRGWNMSQKELRTTSQELKKYPDIEKWAASRKCVGMHDGKK